MKEQRENADKSDLILTDFKSDAAIPFDAFCPSRPIESRSAVHLEFDMASTFKPRIPTVDQALILVLILLASVVDLLGGFKIAGASGMGLSTLIAAAAIWLVWFLRPVLPAGVLPVVLPLIFFELDSLGTLLWYSPDQAGVQLVIVNLAFLGLLMLTARIVARDPSFGITILRALGWSSLISTALYGYKLYSVGASKDGILGDRSFALHEMTVVAALLAVWQKDCLLKMGRRLARIEPTQWFVRQIPLIWSAVIAGLILLSLSRTALIIVLLMYPLVIALRGSRKSMMGSILVVAIGAGLFATALFTFEPLYNRFFHEDAAMKVGNVTINSSGRTKIWAYLLDMQGDDWVFGKGVSSSELITLNHFHNIGQPHNDYLRFYIDQGVFGLALWLITVFILCSRLVKNLRYSIHSRTEDYPLHLAAVVSVAALLLSMLTDNSYAYSFVMLPVALVVGSSLGAASAKDILAQQPLENWQAGHFTGHPV